MAFGHSILAMSGEESLAQVNREIRAPQAEESQARGHRNRHLQPVFTGGATLLASMLIPDLGSARTSTRTI